MALDSTTWAQNIAQAIQSVGVQAGTPVTQSQLEEIWKAVKDEDVSQHGQAEVAPGTFLDSQGNPITGIGGPIS